MNERGEVTAKTEIKTITREYCEKSYFKTAEQSGRNAKLL